jgi:hypothetical protein
MRATRALCVAAPVVVVLVALGAVVSIVQGWPHQFGGQGDPAHVASEFLSSGTALAPPLLVLVILALVAACVRRGDRWGTIACWALVPLSALMIVGSLGEALASPTDDVPRAVQVLDGVWGCVAGVVLAVLAIASLRERRAAPLPA